MNKEQIQNELLDAIHERETLVESYQKHLVEAVNAEHVYALAHATNMVTAEGSSADKREAFVLQVTKDERLKHKLADAIAKGVREALNAKADKISAMQSLLRAEMQEADALRFGQHNG